MKTSIKYSICLFFLLYNMAISQNYEWQNIIEFSNGKISDLKAKSSDDFIFSHRETIKIDNYKIISYATIYCYDRIKNKPVEIFRISAEFSQPEFRVIEYIDSNNIIAAADGYHIYKTKNRGLNLDTIQIKKGNKNILSNCISFCDTLNGVISYYTTDSLYLTRDGGYNWKALPYAFDFVHYLKIFDENTIYYMGKDEKKGEVLFRTFNSGNQWDSIILPYNTRALFFLNKDTGFVATNDFFDTSMPYNVHKVYRTHDGGLNWTLIRDYMNGSEALKDIYFSDYNNGLVLDKMNYIYRTTDAGKTWSWEKPEKPFNKFGAFINKIIYPESGGGLFFYGSRIYKFDIINHITDKNISDYDIYPNPAIEFIQFENFDNYTFFKIIDYTGRIIMHNDLSINEINISYLPSGYYKLLLYNSFNFSIKTFIKK